MINNYDRAGVAAFMAATLLPLYKIAEMALPARLSGGINLLLYLAVMTIVVLSILAADRSRRAR